MPKFWPLYIRRSDGKVDLINKHKQKEKNEPTKEQLDKSPDANGICDYYREVDIDEQKHLDWRRKLGGMLARDLGQSDAERGYMLVTFPEHYRLYEHVKRAADDKGAKVMKNHAGGGNDRQDAYLYGHPHGRKKRYRSPADFYPHLLWLVTDPDADPDNCACKICCPEEVDDKTLPLPKRETTPVVKTEQKSAVKVQSLKQPQVVERKPAVSNTPPPRPLPSRPAETQTPDQNLDLTYGAPLFRQGELVWHSRGQAWGLSIITRRTRNPTQYTVQPLSHPFSHAPAEVKTEEQLRPWLAWSVPNFTHAGLNNLSGLAYSTADWNRIHSGEFGQGDLEVDGSILAARAVDPSLTLTDPSPGGTAGYRGLYLGAERIWVSDVVRLRNNRVTDILVVKSILATSATRIGSGVVLKGDHYTLSSLTLPAGSSADAIPVPATLPVRVQTDLRHRNTASLRARGSASSYTLVKSDSTVESSGVSGRWYEATLLSPLLVGAQVAQGEMRDGTVGEVGLRMNARLDCGRKMGVEERVVGSRREVVGRAVPEGFEVVMGDGGGEGQQGGGQGQGGYQGYQVGFQHGQGQGHSQDPALDEFMNLDG